MLFLNKPPVSVLSLVFFICLLPFLSTYQVGSSTEARELQVARAVYSSCEYILPLRNGLIPSKPPLYHWVTALLGLLVGNINEFVGRAVSLLAAALMLFVTGRLTLEFAKKCMLTVTAQYTTSLLAVFILASSYIFLRLSASAQVDMLFAFFITGALAAALPSVLDYKQGAAAQIIPSDKLLLFCICSALAVLTKGPLGLILPLLILFIVISVLYGYQRALLFFLKPHRGYFCFLLITLPWYLAAYSQGGQAFLLKQLYLENIERFIGGPYSNHKPFWYYLPSLITRGFPWSIIMFWIILRRMLPGESNDPRLASSTYDTIETAAIIWFVGGLLFFSLADGKRHCYLLPVYPAIAIAVSTHLYRMYSPLKNCFVNAANKFLTHLGRHYLFYAALLLLLIEALRWHQYSNILEQIVALEWINKNVVKIEFMLVFAIATLWLVSARYYSGSLAIKIRAAGLIIIAGFCMLTGGLGIKNSFKDFRSAASQINRLAGQSPIYLYKHPRDEFFDPILYYLNRPVKIASAAEELPAGPGTLILVRKSLLKRVAGHNWKILYRYQPIHDITKGRTDRILLLVRRTAS
ncbi:MAG: phospholipid carrier-dependent glycosyltransferase [Candidatus Dadabacteria bacterium]|nr:MAG: phospholipid carrier-dependent glycosyltransferase [Candidatus Dadabacteria bacterium]